MYKIGICDDCQMDIDILKNYIWEVNGHSRGIRIFQYLTGEQLLDNLHMGHHVIFIDIQMPEMNGDRIAIEIRKKNLEVMLVFYSGAVQPTAESFKVQPFRYLIKQSGKENICTEIGEILQEMEKKANAPYICAMYNGNIAKVRMDYIIYASIHGKYTELHVTKEEAERLRIIGTTGSYASAFIYRKKLRDVYQEIEKYGFAYAHNSYIVNFKYVIRKDKYVIKLPDNQELNCSRAREPEFKKKFIEYLNHV